MRTCYCRLLLHFFDWFSHIPELDELSDADKVRSKLDDSRQLAYLQRLLVVDRIVPCVWLLM